MPFYLHTPSCESIWTQNQNTTRHNIVKHSKKSVTLFRDLSANICCLLSLGVLLTAESYEFGYMNRLNSPAQTISPNIFTMGWLITDGAEPTRLSSPGSPIKGLWDERCCPGWMVPNAGGLGGIPLVSVLGPWIYRGTMVFGDILDLQTGHPGASSDAEGVVCELSHLYIQGQQ